METKNDRDLFTALTVGEWRLLPDAPGVYLFTDAAGRPLYIGKAIDLRSRVRQYLTGQDERPRIPALIREAKSIRFIVVRDEREALILERRLIRRHRPDYNSDLKDDKSYPYLALTADSYPQLLVTRNLRRRYRFLRGPFIDAKQLRLFRRALLTLFPLRRCVKTPKKACINEQLGLCPAPCEGKITPAAYHERVRRVIALIEGRGWQEFAAHLSAEVARAAGELRFEKAAELRDILRLIPELKKRFGIESGRAGSTDLAYFSFDKERLFVTIGGYEEGALVEVYHFQQPHEEDDPRNAATAALVSFYEHRAAPPVIACYPAGLLEGAALSELLAVPVSVRVVPRAALTLLARNHALFKERARNAAERETTAEQLFSSLTGVAARSILCLDVSTLQGAHTVAGAVWWEEGRFVTAHYRRFTIRGVTGQNDFASLAEVVRRFRAHWEKGDWPEPELLLVDGGLPQLRAVLPEISDRLPALGIVKDRDKKRGVERLVAPDGAERELGDDPASLLVKKIRDEAHRFSITAHRIARRRGISSLLGDIPGIGPAREKGLIAHFGTVERIAAASRDELRAAPGLTLRAVEALWRHFHEPSRKDSAHQ